MPRSGLPIAQEPPKCYTIEMMLEHVGNQGYPLPKDIVRLPEHPGMALLVYEDGSGLMVAETPDNCIINMAIHKKPAMSVILPQLQSW